MRFMSESETKKIMFLLPIFGGGGGERVVSELSLHLPDSIEKVIVAFQSKEYYEHNARIIVLHIPLSKIFLVKIIIFFVGYLRFRKIVKQEQPDYVMSFGNLQNLINLATRRNPVVRVDNYISEGNKGLIGDFYLFLVRLLFPRSAKVIVVSKEIERDLVDNFHIPKEKVTLIYNPIDTEKISIMTKKPLAKEYEAIFEHPVIINIGSFVGQKGQWNLIRVFAETKKTHPDVKLVFLGEGELEARLKQLAENLGVSDDVHFLGWQKNPFQFLARSKLFVLSSLWEGLGIVILEALACNLPVIASDCKSGPREILAPDTEIAYQTKNLEYGKYGILVPVCSRKFTQAYVPLTEDEKMMKEAVLQVLENEVLSNDFAQKGSERAQDFNIDKIMKKHDFLLEVCHSIKS